MIVPININTSDSQAVAGVYKMAFKNTLFLIF